jgi:hypothetical protein
MVSFVSFLTDFENEDSAIGDLAREVSHDTFINKRWGFNKFMDHIIFMGACEAARLTALEAFQIYRRIK